jgi:hypothetical protein
MSTLHVSPVNDAVGHSIATSEADCICGPETIPVQREDGSMGWLIVHHSLDGREHTEHRP